MQRVAARALWVLAVAALLGLGAGGLAGAGAHPADALPVDASGVPTPPDGGLAGACRGPPCGWIDPILDLQFPMKQACAAGLGERPAPATCHALAPGERLVLEGAMVWWWDVSQDGTYPLDPAEDIVITFTPTARDPPWIPFSVEPASFTLTNADLLDPANYRQEEQEGSAIPRTVFWFERPVTLTLERKGHAGGDEAGLARDRGFESVFVKAKSTGSGERFRPSFGIEEVRFLAEEASQDAPVPLWPLVTLIPLAAWRRARPAR